MGWCFHHYVDTLDERWETTRCGPSYKIEQRQNLLQCLKCDKRKWVQHRGVGVTERVVHIATQRPTQYKWEMW